MLAARSSSLSSPPSLLYPSFLPPSPTSSPSPSVPSGRVSCSLITPRPAGHVYTPPPVTNIPLHSMTYTYVFFLLFFCFVFFVATCPVALHSTFLSFSRCSVWVADAGISYVRHGSGRSSSTLPPEILAPASPHAVTVAPASHAHLPSASRYGLASVFRVGALLHTDTFSHSQIHSLTPRFIIHSRTDLFFFHWRCRQSCNSASVRITTRVVMMNARCLRASGVIRST